MARFRGVSVWLGASAFCLLSGCGAVFLNEGSKNASLAQGLANPDANQKKVNVPKDQCVICNFDDGSKTTSAKLYGGGGGQWLGYAFGGNTLSGDFIASPGANGTAMAAHIAGSLTDKGDSSYPAFTLQGNLKPSGYFDASAFTGIRFYYKCPSDDQALKRRFGIGTAPTLPSANGGTCTDGCFNNFGEDLSTTPDWAQKSYAFADIKRESGWGSPVTPPDLTDHLKEFIDLRWANSANNVAGTYNIDFWVDEVEFY